MLIESTAHLPISLAMFDGVFNAPGGPELGRILLRWIHFVAGITWVGLLYFFNLVNIPFMKELDASLKPKVVPNLMLKTLWWFRWSSVVTVFAGIWYWMIIIGSNRRAAEAAGEHANSGPLIGSFFGI